MPRLQQTRCGAARSLRAAPDVPEAEPESAPFNSGLEAWLPADDRLGAAVDRAGPAAPMTIVTARLARN
jgi:hypothetical protein